jgi:hypothetical protein
MNAQDKTGNLIHLVTLKCKDSERANQCLHALANYGSVDAMSYDCVAYEFGLQAGSTDTVYIVERWKNWANLDALLQDKVVPALPMYNELLASPFNPATDTLRVELSAN